MPVWQGGWLEPALRHESPNFNARPLGVPIDLLVVHYISLPQGRFSGPAVLDFFQNKLDHSAHPYFAQLRNVKVSAHFFLRRTGQLIQLVDCDQRAWHAGQSYFKGRENCNDFSIGVEMEGDGQHAFTLRQYQGLTRLVEQLVMRYPLAAIAGHSDIAPGRKDDPGPFFDWVGFSDSLNRLSSASLEKNLKVERLQTLAAQLRLKIRQMT